MLARLGALATRRPGRTLLACALAASALATQLPKLESAFGYRPLVGADHPAIRRLEGFIERFGGGFPVRVAWSCEASEACDAALGPRSLRMSAELARALAAEPSVRTVRSPATSPILEPAPKGFAVRRLAEGGEPVAERARLAERALEDPLWRSRLVSEDGSTGVLVLQPVDSESATSVALVDALRGALERFEARGFEFHLVGHPVEFVVAGRELAASSAALTPLTAALVGLVLVALTRSGPALVAALVTVGTALVACFGLLGLLGWPQDSILQTLAPLVLVVGVCDAIHVLSAHQRRAARAGAAETRGASLRAALRSVAGPCALTSLTTAGAFLSFATSDLQTFVRFGLVASFGVLVCLLLTFTLLPALRMLLPADRRAAERASKRWEPVLDAVARTGTRRPAALLAAAALLSALCAYGWAAHLSVDTDGYEMYGEESRVVRWIRFFERELARSDTLELELALPGAGALARPGTLERLEALEARLAGVDGLGEPRSLLDLLAWLNRALHGGDPRHARPAESAAANAQLLELAAFREPSLVEPWASFDRRHLRVSVPASFQSHAERGRVLAEVRERSREALPASWGVAYTGQYAVGHQWVDAVQSTQLRSFAAAFAIVAAVLAAALRSLRWTAIALVPTLLPVVVLLGAMGWLGLSLDVGRSMIAAVLLGIGVDDTIHLMSRFRRELARGRAPREAIAGAVRAVGRPVVTSSVALSVGFLSLMSSSWQTVSSFGFFVGLGAMGALAASLFVLPALVVATSGRGAREAA